MPKAKHPNSVRSGETKCLATNSGIVNISLTRSRLTLLANLITVGTQAVKRSRTHINRTTSPVPCNPSVAQISRLVEVLPVDHNLELRYNDQRAPALQASMAALTADARLSSHVQYPLSILQSSCLVLPRTIATIAPEKCSTVVILM